MDIISLTIIYTTVSSEQYLLHSVQQALSFHSDHSHINTHTHTVLRHISLLFGDHSAMLERAMIDLVTATKFPSVPCIQTYKSLMCAS